MWWLIQRQLRSKDEETRQAAMRRVLLMRGERAVRLLAANLIDPSPELRAESVTGLGKVESEDRIPHLVGALQDRDAGVVRAAAAALKRCNDPSLVPSLRPLLWHAAPAVRGQAAQTLDLLGWKPAEMEEEIWHLAARGQIQRAVGFGPPATPILLRALELYDSAPASMLIGIIDTLAQLGDPRAVGPIAQLLATDNSPVCVAALEALSRLGASEAIPQFIKCLRHPQSQVRVAAAEALGRLRVTEAAEALRGTLDDSVWEVRREAIQALAKIKDKASVELLGKRLSDTDPDVREATAMALGSLRDRRALGPLVLALKDGTGGVRRLAAAAQSRIDPDWSSSAEARAAAEQLKPALYAEDSAVRHLVGQVLTSLGAISPEEAPPGGLEELSTSSPAKRQKLAVSLFLSLLCDMDGDVRQASAECLGRLKDDRARSALQRAATDPEPDVRGAAAAALLDLEAATT
jgi:HEAT repeat protein